MAGTPLERFRTILTLMQSAIWHGFYPGYFLAFGSAQLLISIGRRFGANSESDRSSLRFWSYAALTKALMDYTFAPFAVSVLSF